MGSGADTFVAASLLDPLRRYLRALWVGEPALQFADGAPFIADRKIHLPNTRGTADRTAAWRWYRAAAAHAAAHLAFSPPVFDGRGLPPITRAILALLEDARVESLACRELPGLRRLWQSLHTASPADGDSFEALLGRLARALLDPGHADPHPWVLKGRQVFFADVAMGILAVRRPDELRAAASLLGHDIGQMRLQFNARLHVTMPDYRDDSRWMWPSADAQQPESTTSTGGRIESRPGDTQDEHRVLPEARRYPEWDRLISRLRRDWCTVMELPVAPLDERPDHDTTSAGIWNDQQLIRQLMRAVPRRPPTCKTWRALLSHEGERIDLDALVQVRVAQSRRAFVDPRIHRRDTTTAGNGRLMIVIDHSASSADAWSRSEGNLLQASRRVAAAVASAMQRGALRVAILGFSSNGRHAVAIQPVKAFSEPAGPAMRNRLEALRSEHSTRLGAVIRHATHQVLATRSAGVRQILIITDGRPHDIDVHDPAYLADDARHAVWTALRQGVRLDCIVLERDGLTAARRIFGNRHVGVLEHMRHLPRLAGRLAL